MEVFFDTNAYRNLVHGLSIGEVVALTNDIKKAEEVLGHTAIASTVVSMELIQHLLDGDAAKDDCYKALNN
ncbi:hypothetical protein SAMN05660461_0948 [Chitinophaga ginsengisegetis]|uniref:PIN domain-containing protein n=1 Tax=Chitinophaga ginsengisegetis TaxID=393003 RepID=A0A1T5NAR4_9BACT|nr:hypothetical protein [Chitinophaga ginsengisegetis]SKC97567.1 hypothetical protein SAMN05660461_0948 [Chitinophaga ginsengisegetis]